MRLRAALDAPELAAFVAALDPVNALAEQSPGFVWRLKTGDGNSDRRFASSATPR